MANFVEKIGSPVPQEKPKPDLRVIEGGAGEEPERISPEEWEQITTKPGMPKPREHGEEAPVDLKALFREDARVTGEKVQDIREKINLPKPREHEAEQISSEEMQEFLTKPNMPKPRAHGAEAPIDMSEVMRAPQPEAPKFEGELPVPRAHEAEQIREEEFQEILTKPNMPKPRAHGAEAPIDMSEVMRAPQPEAPKFEGELPVPPGQELTAEDIIEEDEAPTVRRAA